MNKLYKQNQQLSPQKHGRKQRRASLLLRYIGLSLLTLGSFDLFSELLHAAESGAVGFMLLWKYEIECLAAGFAIWIGGGLLLDYLERQNERDQK